VRWLEELIANERCGRPPHTGPATGQASPGTGPAPG
ncbi:PadR family transcriptional regulator, partial [Micromonospora zhanjiangensis]